MRVWVTIISSMLIVIVLTKGYLKLLMIRMFKKTKLYLLNLNKKD